MTDVRETLKPLLAEQAAKANGGSKHSTGSVNLESVDGELGVRESTNSTVSTK